MGATTPRPPDAQTRVALARCAAASLCQQTDTHKVRMFLPLSGADAPSGARFYKCGARVTGSDAAARHALA